MPRSGKKRRLHHKRCMRKEESTSDLQDLLIFACQGLAYTTMAARQQGLKTDKESLHITHCLFVTITNANFSDAMIQKDIEKCVALRDALKAKVNVKETHPSISWTAEKTSFEAQAKKVSPQSYDDNEDLRSLKQYILFGVKGVAAYAQHAYNLQHQDDDIFHFMEESLVVISQHKTQDELLGQLMRTGEYGVKVMALLDGANTSSYGTPEISNVNIGVQKRPGILVSGHDLKDLEELLTQTEGQGIDIYTHCEMLPAHAYPQFKKFSHLVGNYGGAWYDQIKDFETFNGPILFTTNCLVPPRKSATYNDRVFTSGATGMPGWKHINTQLPNGQKDFSELIALAKTCVAPTEIEQGALTVGFAHSQVLSLADKILDAVNSGAIKKMVVMSGCDARQKSRNYYTDFAKALPQDTVILTSGCAKFRYNKLQLGDIGGIPRVLDAGQCNDSYSWAVVALKLKEVLGLDDINQLPIEFNIAWYEQKAIIVHLALLYLGLKDMHIGPTLPAFITPNVLKVVQDLFGVQGITNVEDDMKILNIAS